MSSSHLSFEDLRSLMLATPLGRSLLARHGEKPLPVAWNLLDSSRRALALPEVFLPHGGVADEEIYRVADALWRGFMDLDALQARPENLLRHGGEEEVLQVTLLQRHGVPVVLRPSVYEWQDRAFQAEDGVHLRGGFPPREGREAPPGAPVPLVAAFHLQEETWYESYDEDYGSHQEGLAALLVFADGGARRYRLPASLFTMKTLMKEVQGAAKRGALPPLL